MILHLGGDVVVPTKDIIAIIDIDSIIGSKTNEEFLSIAEEEGFVQNISEQDPKALVLTEVDKKSVIYLSSISSVTLLKRSGFLEEISLVKEK